MLSPSFFAFIIAQTFLINNKIGKNNKKKPHERGEKTKKWPLTVFFLHKTQSRVTADSWYLTSFYPLFLRLPYVFLSPWPFSWNIRRWAFTGLPLLSPLPSMVGFLMITYLICLCSKRDFDLRFMDLYLLNLYKTLHRRDFARQSDQIPYTMLLAMGRPCNFTCTLAYPPFFSFALTNYLLRNGFLLVHWTILLCVYIITQKNGNINWQISKR